MNYNVASSRRLANRFVGWSCH